MQAHWNVMATCCNLNPSIVETIKLLSFGEPTYQRRDERVVRIGAASTVPRISELLSAAFGPREDKPANLI